MFHERQDIGNHECNAIDVFFMMGKVYVLFVIRMAFCSFWSVQ